VRTKTPLQAEKILTVAARLFALHRFHEVRMEDIAATAEVGKGTLYRYFKDKDELYRALLERAAEQVLRRVAESAARPGGPREQLEAFVGALITYFDEQPYLFDLIQHAEMRHHTDADFPWQRARNETIRRSREILTQGREAGLFGSVQDVELAALLLLGGVRAVLRFGGRPRPPDLARRVVDQFCAGIAGRGGPAGAPWAGHPRVGEPSRS